MTYIRFNKGPHAIPLLKSQILEAQTNTKSAFEAARYLNVSYKTYKKYAKMYGIFEQHKNQPGAGIRKGISYVRGHKLEEVLEGKHPTYNFKRLKDRLIRAGILEEECAQCGFKERRISDYKVPLLLIAKDGDNRNHVLKNLALLCFNCTFLSYGDQYNIGPYHLRDDDETTVSEHPDSIYSKRAELVDSDDDLPERESDAENEITLTDTELVDALRPFSPEEIERMRQEVQRP
jgi:hypothetical protein